jgi:hypothetical protein
MGSAAHRANILRPQFTEVGIGVAEGTYKGTQTIYVVQVFATPNPVTVATAKPKPAPAPKPEAVRTPAPTLSVAPVPQTSIVTKVNVLTAPVVHQIAPVTRPAPKATTTVATSSPVATSTVTYALAPEFFAPVQVPDAGGEVLAPYVPPQQVAAPNSNWVSRTKAYLGDLYSKVPRFWE